MFDKIMIGAAVGLAVTTLFVTAVGVTLSTMPTVAALYVTKVVCGTMFAAVFLGTATIFVLSCRDS